MNPSIWTGMYADRPLAQALGVLADCGWTEFEVSTEHLAEIDASRAADDDIGRALEAARARGLTMSQAHLHLGAELAHVDPARREDDLARCERHLGIAARLGVRVVVTHPGRGDGHTTAQERAALIEVNVESFRRLGDLAASLEVRIAIENMMDGRKRVGGRSLGALPHELLELLRAADHPALGVCLDTSHASVQNLDIPAAIREFGRALIATHISDNDGSGDQHLSPGGGRVEWRGVVAALRETGYAGSFNLEIPGERHRDPEIQLMHSRHALEISGMLLGA